MLINLTEQVTPKTKKMNFVAIKNIKFWFRGYRQKNELNVVDPHFPDGTP